MNEQEYLKKSDKSKLPKRCPLVGYCERWALTKYYFGQHYKFGSGSPIDRLNKEGVVNKDYEDKKVNLRGEEVQFSSSPDNWSPESVTYNNVCPEVPLFDEAYRFPFMDKSATVSGSWDKYRKGEEFKKLAIKHYSDCSEFSAYSFKTNAIKPLDIKSFVYLMKNKSNGRIKIGYSNDPSYREKTLQSEEPDIELLFKWPAPRRMEKELHKLFKDKKIRGEWFQLTDSEIDKIADIMKDFKQDIDL